MIVKEVKHLLLKGERIILECKEAKNAVSKPIYVSYSTFNQTS